ncbi:MAG: LCP family protein [Candidatus Moranbacteria bacterium]|nr:LCP family protein [Candidatus Moranbacteria bacterium]
MDIVRKNSRKKTSPMRPHRPDRTHRVERPQPTAPVQKTNPAFNSEISYRKIQNIPSYPNKQSSQQSKKRTPLFYVSHKRNNGVLRKITRAFFIFILTILALVILTASYALLRVHTLNKKITVENTGNEATLSDSAKFLASSLYDEERMPLNGESDGRINVLLLGIAGEGKPGTNLTDTIMVASINTKTKKIALTSLPRDLYVKVSDSTYSSKINSIYQIGISQNKGVDLIKQTVEKITGLPMHYYVILNFDGFTQIIDDVGGITVTNERDIYDSRYPGPNYSYELFELKKGTHTLNGETALKYARQRHGDPEGDFGRAKRQQQVIQAFKNKFFSKKTLLNIFTINRLLETLGENIKTNIQLSEAESFLKLTQDLDTQNISNAVVDAWKKDSLLRVSHIYYESGRAFILVPRVGNFSEIQELSENIFELDAIKRRKSEIEKEDAKIAIINYTRESNAARKIKNLLNNNLGLKNTELMKSILYSSLAPKNTLVIDNTSGQKSFSLDEIIKKVGATLTDDFNIINESPEVIAQYDIFIIIGEDAGKHYDYDEQVLEDLSEEELNKLYLEFSR